VNAPQRLDAEYVLPLKWSDESGVAELADYLRRVAEWIDVTVVDGSDPDRFATHAAAWGNVVRHIPVAVHAGANGKVRGVLTGIAAARHERVVLADDDVRYDAEGLARVVAALADADLVKPQNHFRPLPGTLAGTPAGRSSTALWAVTIRGRTAFDARR